MYSTNGDNSEKKRKAARLRKHAGELFPKHAVFVLCALRVGGLKPSPGIPHPRGVRNVACLHDKTADKESKTPTNSVAARAGEGVRARGGRGGGSRGGRGAGGLSYVLTLSHGSVKTGRN